jgi:hypothetical protein
MSHSLSLFKRRAAFFKLKGSCWGPTRPFGAIEVHLDPLHDKGKRHTHRKRARTSARNFGPITRPTVTYM